ncbi:MAG: DegV family protein [Actinomycetota bacterium]|nr:DegV family protein [Actinomycetota bacterium]
MAGIRLVTDGASDLTPALIGELPVTVVPLDVRLGELGPADTQKMSPEAFWQACAATTALPETSAPSPGDFQRAFLDAKARGEDGVVCVTLSSELSATYQAAASAAASVSAQIPVEVIDSRSATMGEGLIVLDAAARAAKGASFGEVVTAVRRCITEIVAVGTLDTLENLRRGGRIGSAQAFFGALLSVKPVIQIADGVVAGESRQRTRGRSLAYVVEKVAASGPFQRLAVVHAAAPDIDQFVELASRLHPREEILVATIGPVVGAHTGPGTVAICAQRAVAGGEGGSQR